MTQRGRSGKRIVVILLGLVALAVLVAWLGFHRLVGVGEGIQPGTGGAPRVLSDGVLYTAESGDPAFVRAQSIKSGKEVWRTDLGMVAAPPVIVVLEDVVEVQIAGTPWMTLDKASGEPLD
ncbi:MAG: hypothetical protein AAGF92_21240 [Myxococcota bacterium]